MHLECRGLTFKYPRSETYVFKDLSIRLAEPGFHALFGPSGVGKTSFARIITGDLQPEAGAVITEGIDRPAYTYNLERLPGWSAVGRHLDKITPESEAHRKPALIEFFGIQKCLDQRFSQLSLGQKNRINLIRYLLQDFQLMILDESLANVDEITRERILLNIKHLFPNTLFLYISHNVVEVSKFCKKILVFRGPRKDPQIAVVEGQDLQKDRETDPEKLDRTMLEIMNAS
ncbi:MAG: ATP-binding cassette domain-containing protein [Desulfococcaceae bacterium]